MRTKGPLLLMAVFLIGLGAFIMWGATLLFAIAVPMGIFMALLSLFAAGFGVYFIAKTMGHLGSIRQLVYRSRHEYIRLDKLSAHDVRALENELVAVKKWTRKNMAFGLVFIVLACLVPVRFLGLHNFMHSLSSGNGHETLVQHTGGLILFAVVFCIEAFLLYNATTDRKNIMTDLRELQKIKLRGKVKGIDTEKFDRSKGTLVVNVEGMELEREINPQFDTRFETGTEVEVNLAIHSQTILGIEPVAIKDFDHYR